MVICNFLLVVDSVAVVVVAVVVVAAVVVLTTSELGLLSCYNWAKIEKIIVHVHGNISLCVTCKFLTMVADLDANPNKIGLK